MRRRDLLIGSLALPLLNAEGEPVRAAGTPVAADDWAHPEWFADPKWIAQHDNDPATRIIALTPPEDYAKAHIPGAAVVDWPELKLTDSADATIATWRSTVEQILTDHGVNRESDVVIYDGGTFYAARLWWILDQLGHVEKRVLNGGLPAWKDFGGSIEQGPGGPPPAREPYVGTPNEETLARIDEVADASENGAAVLVDARTSEEYAKGHIPGAVNIPFLDNAEPDSGGQWKAPADLRAMYADKGVTPDELIISYCSTGVRSATTWFTLRALGYDHVKLYSASYEEWSSDPARPIETGTTS